MTTYRASRWVTVIGIATMSSLPLGAAQHVWSPPTQRGAGNPPSAAQIEEFCGGYAQRSPAEEARHAAAYKKYCVAGKAPLRAPARVAGLTLPRCLSGLAGEEIVVRGEHLREGRLSCRLSGAGRGVGLRKRQASEREYRYAVTGDVVPEGRYALRCDVRGRVAVQETLVACPPRPARPVPAQPGIPDAPVPAQTERARVDLVGELELLEPVPAGGRRVRVRVRDRGDGTASGDRVAVEVVLADRDVSRTLSTSPLVPGILQRRRVQAVVGNAVGAPVVEMAVLEMPDAAWWCAHADPDDAVTETDERNNVTCVPANPQTLAGEALEDIRRPGTFGSALRKEVTLPPMVSEADLRQHAVPLSGHAAEDLGTGLARIAADGGARSAAEPGLAGGYGYLTEEECGREPYGANDCVADIYQCSDGECEKVGERVRYSNCWEPRPGVEVCETRTVIRRCDRTGPCVTTSVRVVSESCEGDACAERSTEYVCVPPSPDNPDAYLSGLLCPDGSRRSRDSESSEPGVASAEQWNCDAETGRCEVTLTINRENDDGSSEETTEQYDCPGDRQNAELSVDCELIASTTYQCNAAGECRRQSRGSDPDNTERVVTHPDGSQTSESVECDPESDRCAVVRATTSTNADGTTSRSQETSDCSRPVAGEMTCEIVEVREETCTSRSGRDPRTGEDIALPSDSCTLTIYSAGEYPRTVAEGCPEGTDQPERDCGRGERQEFICHDGVCTGINTAWDNEEGTTSRTECSTHSTETSTSRADSACFVTRGETRSRSTLADGGQRHYSADTQCDVDTGHCETTTSESRCSPDGSRCSSSRTRRRHCHEGGSPWGYDYFRNPEACESLEQEESDTWTTVCDPQGHCVREGEAEECFQPYDRTDARPWCGRVREYRVEETCRAGSIVEGGGLICEVTASWERYHNEDGLAVTTDIECNLEARVCTKVVTAAGSVARYTCTPDPADQPAPYTYCSVDVGTVRAPASGSD